VTYSANNSKRFDLRTIFLDRDGVLNEKMPEGRYVRSWNEFHLLPGVTHAIRQLNQSGQRVIVVSNQRGIALGLYSAADLAAIHSQLQAELWNHGAHVDGIYCCPHDKGQCNCRKPLPGLFEQAVEEFPDITSATCAMVGDSLSDIEFGHRLGMLTVLVNGGNLLHSCCGQQAAELANLRFPDLLKAVNALSAGSSLSVLGVNSSLPCRPWKFWNSTGA
jgi:D-glycero-D-manno-heptose 1,7-bisphosphate phosphatase